MITPPHGCGGGSWGISEIIRSIHFHIKSLRKENISSPTHPFPGCDYIALHIPVGALLRPGCFTDAFGVKSSAAAS